MKEAGPTPDRRLHITSSNGEIWQRRGVIVVLKSRRTIGRLRVAMLLPLGAVFLTWIAPSAQARPLDVQDVQVHDRPVEPEDAAAHPSAFSTTIDQERAAQEAATLPEVLSETVGVQVRSLGGLGAFSAVLIRGSSPQQIAVFLDGIPLNRAGADAVDLSTLPFFLLDRIEIFRGFLPAEFGSSAMGGGINLVTRFPTAKATHEVFASMGCWYMRRIGLERAQSIGSWGYVLSAAYQGSQGGFRYFDDHQTPYQPADDQFRKRDNNAFNQVQFLGRVRHVGRLKLAVVENLAWKSSQLAGTASQPPIEGPFYSYLRQGLSIQLDRSRPAGLPIAVMARLYGLFFREHFSNPEGKLLSVGRTDSIQHNWSTGLTARLQYFWGTHQILSVIPDLSAQFYRDMERLDAADWSPVRSRLSSGIAIRDEIFLAHGRLYLAPVVRVDILSDWLEQSHRIAWLPSPRLGASVTITSGLSLKANAGRYFRPATFMELFGQHGIVRGNTDLEPENGWNMDFGPKYSRRFRSWWVNRLDVEVAGFGRRASNLIFLLPTARALVAQNWGDAWIAGLEASATVWLFRHTKMTVNYTFTHTTYLGPTTNMKGNELPGRTKHDVFARFDWAKTWHRWGLGGYCEVQYLSPFYRDLGNRSQGGRRIFLAIGLKVAPWVEGLTITVEGRNLIGQITETIPAPPNTHLGTIRQSLADYAGYPMPGRTFFVTANWKH